MKLTILARWINEVVIFTESFNNIFVKNTARLIVLSLLMLFSSAAFGQESESILTIGADGLYQYEKVIEVPSKSKNDIYGSIKGWVVKNVKSQSNTNYFDDEGKNTISTTIAFVVVNNSSAEFKLNIELKEGKYRLTANSFIWHSALGTPKKLGDFKGINNSKKAQEKIVKDVQDNFAKIIASLEHATKSDNSW